MSAKLNLANVGLVALKSDKIAYDISSILSRIGLYHRPGMITENDELIETRRVERMLERFPCFSDKVWTELLERMRRIDGELAKCAALIEKNESPFRVNQQKEAL
jgi:hypothetical protein